MKFPNFELLNQDGKKISLKDFYGKRVVIYFYPKDFTVGCTLETRDFQKNYSLFKKKNFEVVGISSGSVSMHKKFAKMLKVKFNLLVDENSKLAKKLKIWKKKSFMGKTFYVIERTTFVLDERGEVKKVYRKVNPKGHVKQVLADVEKLF